MEPGTKRSLYARISSAHQRLDRILDSFWFWLVSLFSKHSPYKTSSDGYQHEPYKDESSKGQTSTRGGHILNEHNPGPNEKKGQNKAKKTLEYIKNFLKAFVRKLSEPQFFVEVAALIGLFFYAFVTYNQWQDSRANFRADERSWLKFGVAWPELAEQKPAVINGTFVNVGKSVITGMYGEAAFEVVPSEDPPSFSLKQRHSTTGMKPIFPNDAASFPIQLWDQKIKQPRAFTPEEVQKLMGGKMYVATFGMVIYSDQFGTHWYRFCNFHGYSQGSSANGTDCVNWNIAGDGKPTVSF